MPRAQHNCLRCCFVYDCHKRSQIRRIMPVTSTSRLTFDHPPTAHPSKKDWSRKTCDSADNMDRLGSAAAPRRGRHSYSPRARAMGDNCPCWDGLSKGTYSLDKKSVMFNINSESLGIWAVTVMFICITYAGFKSLVQLFFDGHLRFLALLPVLANVHGDHIFFFQH
jgi:hypothetical protein